MRAATKWRLAYLGLAAVDTWLSGLNGPDGAKSRGRLLRRATKPLLMPTLAARTLTDPRAHGSPLLATTVAAQVFGGGGDIALLRHDTRAFLLGASSFAVGHGCYIAGFRRIAEPGPVTRAPAARKILLAGGLGAVALGLAAGRQESALRVGVPAYAMVLSTMTAHGAHLSPAGSSTARGLLFGGALAFLASDSILGARRFLVSDPPAWMERSVMATYTAAQLLLAEGTVRIR